MTRIIRLALAASIVLVMGAFTGTSVGKTVSSTPRTFLAHVAPAASMDDAVTRARFLGVGVGARYDEIGVFVVGGTLEGLGRLQRSSLVTHLEPNSRLTFFTDSSHDATRGSQVLDGPSRASASPVDGSGVGVAIVDTGVDGTHPDLVARMGGNVRIVCSAPGWAAFGPASECNGPKSAVEVPDSDAPGASGHGTHVAGIVAGTGAQSSATYHGAAPGATLYGVGIGTVILVENALDGLKWVLDNHDQVIPRIRVVNNSWGSGYAPPDAPQISAITKMVDALVNEGVTVVFAAGNGGGNGTSPTTSAQCVNPTPGVICVANYDDGGSGTRDGSITPSSSRGQADDAGTWPDLSAPGTSIVSTCKPTLPVCLLGARAEEPFYSSLTGTSMAAPHVAGIAAQMLQVNPRLTPARIEALLKNTAHKFSWGAKYKRDPHHPKGQSSFEKGHGLVDALRAVKVARRDLRR